MTISLTLIGTILAGNVVNNGTKTLAFPGTVPAGATIVVAGIWAGGVGAAGITDGANTYNLLEINSTNGSSWGYGIWAATNVTSRTSANSITVTNTGGLTAPFAMQVFYLTSSTNAEILPDSASYTQTPSASGASVSLVSGSPAYSNEFFVGGGIGSFTGKTISFSSGWTQAGSTLTASSDEIFVATHQQSGSGTVTFNPSTTASEGWNLVLVGFHEQSASVSGTWSSTDTKDTFLAHGGLIGGHWASTDTKDTFAAVGHTEYPTGTWASTETKDTFHGIVDPITGVWSVTELPDTFFAKAYEIDSSIIQSMLFPLSMSMTVTEIIPTRIVTNLPLFSQVMEVEEVPATYFVTGQAVTTFKGFSQEATVTITLPEPVSIAEMNPPGRGGGGSLPTISTEQELLDLFGGHAFNRGVDAIVPSTRVAASNLTTAFSPKSVVRPPTPPPPRRRK